MKTPSTEEKIRSTQIEMERVVRCSNDENRDRDG
jgi:hypothetical protein